MSFRFIHAADVHLGFEQYGENERYNDFGRAFSWLVSEAIARRVDLLLVAGDLFHRTSLDPRTLYQATRGLERLRDAHIPVVVVQGNHEQIHNLDRLSWLGYLARTRLLTLLSVTYADDCLRLTPVPPNETTGTYIDLPGGVRVIGLPYAGASTSRLVKDLAEALPGLPDPQPAYTILMLHAGLEGVLPNVSGGLTHAQLAPLRPYVNYIAMGHVHKPFQHDDWVHNPGSLETNSTLETPWTERGCLLVELDHSSPAGHAVTRLVNPRRPFLTFELPVDTFESPEALYGALERLLADHPRAEDPLKQPVVLLRLRGILTFHSIELETARLETIVHQALNPLHLDVRDESSPPGGLATRIEGLSPEELERQVLTELIERDLQYRGQGQRMANLVVQVKRMALARSASEAIVDELRAFAREDASEDASC